MHKKASSTTRQALDRTTATTYHDYTTYHVERHIETCSHILKGYEGTMSSARYTKEHSATV